MKKLGVLAMLGVLVIGGFALADHCNTQVVERVRLGHHSDYYRKVADVVIVKERERVYAPVEANYSHQKTYTWGAVDDEKTLEEKVADKVLARLEGLLKGKQVATPEPEQGNVEYLKDNPVVSILTSNSCMQCHQEGKDPKKGFVIFDAEGKLKSWADPIKEARFRRMIEEEVGEGRMPPKEKGFDTMSSADYQVINRWTIDSLKLFEKEVK